MGKSQSQTDYIRRRATARREDGSFETRWLDEWRCEDVYVLLGDPGAGKSRSLAVEAAAAGERIVPAGVIQEDLEPHAATGRTIFIDALDEVRGGGGHGSDALAAIARWLKHSGSPRFRLACREAEWRGESDRQLIERAAPGGRVVTLHLEPLTHDDVLRVLRHSSAAVTDPEKFMAAAERHGVIDLLGNPLLLELMIQAVAEGRGEWPETRLAVYEAACRRMADEASPVHRRNVALAPGRIDRILDDAGLMCAVLLLSGKPSIPISGPRHSTDIDLQSLPGELQFADAKAALSSKVFTIDGGRAVPRHRTVAEFLAARAIGRRVPAGGLPLARVLALMQGFDGKPVEAMRGLFAWLAVHLHGADRQQLLQLDPLGFILNGDAASLIRHERLLILRSLASSAADNRWFRSGQWVAHPFGPLATRDMIDEYEAQLAKPDRDVAWQAYIDCLMDALAHARDDLPELSAHLTAWVVDATGIDGVRLGAYDAWRRHCPADQQPSQIRSWLDGLLDESIKDHDDRLMAKLLQDAYPGVLQADVLRYFRPNGPRRHSAEFPYFWAYCLVKQTPIDQLPALANAWVARFPEGLPVGWRSDAQRTADSLLIATLEAAGCTASIDTLYAWLGIGLGGHDVDRSNTEERQKIAAWLETRPKLMKAVADIGYLSQRPDQHGHKAYWRAEARLRGAARPRDWILWNLDLASRSEDAHFVQWVVERVASTVLDQSLSFDVPAMDTVVDWVTALSGRFPAAPEWLQACWTVSLEDWRADDHRRSVRYRAESEHAREQRRRSYEPLLEKLDREPLPPQVLYQIALAYDNRFSNIGGDTPEERVADALGATLQTASAALAVLDTALDRNDLPEVDEILDLEAKGREHFLRPAALLAALRATERDAAAWSGWSDRVRAKLIAFWLTYGAGDEPDWYKSIAAAKPDLIAPILVRYASAKLRRKTPQAITGLSGLAHEESLQGLVELTLPKMLERFPKRANEQARDVLNRSLLAALPRLDDALALGIVRRKLGLASIDTGQRIAWKVALLPHDPSSAAALAALVQRNGRRAAILGTALRGQGTLGRSAHALPPSSLQLLVEVLAPITPYEPDWEGGPVTEVHDREETVKRLLENLGRNPAAEAGNVLQAMVASGTLGKWQSIAEYNLQAQRAARREASFAAASPEAAARVLANGPPANPPDLAALVIEHLRSIEAALRGDPSFQLCQFWTAESAPRPEEWCRNVLLSLLRPKLEAQHIDLQPESMAAASKRMDLRVTTFQSSGQRLTLPIEAKKDNHREVWSAWRTQLQALYAIDPTAAGFGIYLVFWFGHQSKPSPEGYRPSSARDLEQHLRSRMTETERQRLRVHVMDLSWPMSAKRPGTSSQ